MIWKSTIDHPLAPSQEEVNRRIADWWQPRSDGFGLPLVAAIFGYQPAEDSELELLVAPESARGLG